MKLKPVMQRLSVYERLMRLDKPIGILLLLWPTLWALWLAGNGSPDWLVVWIFVLGTVLMRSAGCVMNDVADRNFDGRVQRTRARPLAAGEVGVGEALALAVFLSLLAFGLVLFLNRLTVWLSLAALLLAASYPFTKRFFAIPQAYLGIAFGFGIPMAYAALTNAVPPVAWLLLMANVCWAIAYDTEYAMVDREDDRKIGIKTSAITFGRHDVKTVMICQAIFLLILAWIGWRYALGMYFFVGLLAAAGLAATHYPMIKDRDPQSCFRAFRHNNWIGAMVFAGLEASFRFPTPF